MLKKLFAVIGIAAMIFCASPVMADGPFLGNAQSSDSAGAISGDSFGPFLGVGAGYNSGGSAEAQGAAGSLWNFKAKSDSKVTVVAGIGDTDLDIDVNFSKKGLTTTVTVGAEGTGIAKGKVKAEACGLLSAAYGKLELTAYQENWSNAANVNLFDLNDYGQASAYNTSTATSVTEKLDVGFLSADIRICDFVKTHGETVTWVTVAQGGNYVQSGAFSGNNEGIGDKLTASGNVAQMAQVTTKSGQGIAGGTASFSGTDGFAASVGTVTGSHGVIVATSHSHAETGSYNQPD